MPYANAELPSHAVPPLRPMLCGQLKAWPADTRGLVLEPKWDGFRVLLFRRRNGSVSLHSRNGARLPIEHLDLADTAAQLLEPESVLDGELVAIARTPSGEIGSDFDAIAPSLGRHGPEPGVQLRVVCFDVLLAAGEPIWPRPWTQRRQHLEALLGDVEDGPVRLITTHEADPTVHRRLLADGFEGSVLKRRNGVYRPGERSTTWSKLKGHQLTVAHIAHAAVDDRGQVDRVRLIEPRGAWVQPRQLGWAQVWAPLLRRQLTGAPNRGVGLNVTVAYSSTTIYGRLREARALELA